MAEINGTVTPPKDGRPTSSIHKVILPRNLPITASNIASQLPDNGITNSEESLEAVRNGVRLMNSVRGQAAINKLKGGQTTGNLADLLAELELGGNPTEEEKKEFWSTRSFSIENGVDLSTMGGAEGECIVFDLGLTVGDLGNMDAVSQAEAKDRALWLEHGELAANLDDQNAAVTKSSDIAEVGDQSRDGTRISKQFNASEPFTYEPLNPEAKEIRLIRLCRPERCTSDGSMMIELNRYSLEDIPPYLALSYAWRNPVPTESIVCNGGQFKITASLDWALRRVFTWREDIHIWADGICINQNDTQERGAQVQIMGEIYRSAQLTAAYLGEPIWAGEKIDGVEADELPFALMEVLNRIWRGDAGHEEAGPRTEEQWKELQVPSDESELKPWKSLIFLCQQPWFTRSWVLQEVALAKSVVVFYGNAVNELECLTEFWKHATQRDLPPALRHGLISEWKIGIETSNQLNVFRDLRERGLAQPTESKASEDEGSSTTAKAQTSAPASGRSLLDLLIKNRQAEWLPNVGRLNHHKRNLNDVIVSMNIDEPIGDSLKLQTLEIPEPFGPTGGQELHVLGIKGVEDDNGKIRLWVVNNRPAVDTATSTLLDQGLSGANSTVEVFRVAKAKGKLEHVETFTDPEISTPNNIAPLGGDSNGFYFTNDHGKSKTGWGHILSPYLGTGSLSFCNSTSCREVVSGLKFPNGLVKGQDGLIYVPSSFVGGIGVYKALPNGDVQKVGHVPTENALDNLSVDREGHIWAAAFHAGQRIIDGFDDPLNALSPTGALRVKKGAEGYEVERVLEDGKIEVLPATTTVVHDAKTGRLFFSGVYSPFIALCEKR